MAKKINSKSILKDISIVVLGIFVIWIGLQVGLGANNPFYVVVSGSMIPALEIYDVIIVQGDCVDFLGYLNSENCIRFDWYTPFEETEIGDIIVFDRPKDHERVIVHRIVSISNDDPKTIRTQGDANPGSIPGTDFPITEEDYIGKVVYVIPQLGYLTQALSPPTNYIIIAIVVGIMVIKQFAKKNKEKKSSLDFTKSDDESSDVPEELSDINEIEKDSEYSEDLKKSNIETEDESEDLKKDDSETDENNSK